MDRTNTDLKKVNGVDASYLTKYISEDKSLEGMDEYRVLPRLKIIQTVTDQVLKKNFGEGSVIIQPGKVLVCDSESSFLFVPLLFMVEFATWSDLNDKESAVITDRTFDPTHPIAKKSRDPSKRHETYDGHETRPEGDQWKYRHVEHLRFPGFIYGDHPLTGVPVALSFERGEFFQGKNFISAIKLRRQKIVIEGEERSINVPLWAQVWEIKVDFRDRGSRKWYGFDFKPAEIPLVPPEDIEEMQRSHIELKELYDQQRLAIDEETRDVDPAEVSPTDEY